MKHTIVLVCVLLLTTLSWGKGKGSSGHGASYSYTFGGKTYTYTPPQAAAHVQTSPPLGATVNHYPKKAESKIFNAGQPK